jgi:hypothetical protein
MELPVICYSCVLHVVGPAESFMDDVTHMWLVANRWKGNEQMAHSAVDCCEAPTQAPYDVLPVLLCAVLCCVLRLAGSTLLKNLSAMQMPLLKSSLGQQR